ncbi:H(+)/Cl(-) exchange transporter ClcA [bacterium]|nr:H(+)/Cl(-) exchange transporter ClcA [bacterium]
MSETSQPHTSEPSATVVERRIGDLSRSHEMRRRQLPRALVVGVTAGLIAVAFRWALHWAEWWRGTVVADAHAMGWRGIFIPLALAVGGAVLSVALVSRWAPEAAGSGIPHLKAVLDHLRQLVGPRVLAVKFAGGLLAIGSGLALGREGPTVQMGGAVGQIVGGWLRCTPRERRTLVAAGAGAGLSAAFNAPLAGLVFVLEEVQRDFGANVFAATLAASVTADIIARLLLGQTPVFHVAIDAIPELDLLPLAGIIGLVAAGFGVLFNRGLLASLDLADRLRARFAVAPAALAGLLTGLALWFAPDVVGTGAPVLERMLTGEMGLLALAALFASRFLLTLAGYGSGAPGGIFAPMLILGAALGLAIAAGTDTLLALSSNDLRAVAVVGMAAYFAAVVRAPLTGIVLMVEMTGQYALVLPLALASAVAYGVAEYVREPPIYQALLARELRAARQHERLAQPLLLELAVAGGAPFDGRRVRDLALPAGCLVVSIERAGATLVPTADTVVEAGDRVSVIVAPDAGAAVSLLRHGAGI